MKKKIVFLPYDFDTALGINNEGALVFGYNLEDIDQIDGGADVYNGQQSVLWRNLRITYFDELKTMYQKLRSTGALSYDKVEDLFEEHQGKWPEAIFNEDAWYKYLAPLVEDGSAAYLSMLQGSKTEQRKWWLYNRFRYIDSKYNAGDALSDVITVRGYAKADITVTPYADVYTSVKFGSYLVQKRAERNKAVVMECPLDNVNDTEIYIYSASQLASVGDLSGLMVGYAEFSLATKLQSLKVGDASSSYSNGNLTELYLGNNTLLRTLDVRNCPNLTQAVDVSGCTNLEEVYFDGTAITGLSLPNGGILKVLHLPATITNLTVRNQKALTDVTIPSYEKISTLRLENVSSAIDSKAILKTIAAGSRVRLIGFDWDAANATEINSLLDLFDTMRGLDENGGNVDKAQISGIIHVATITGAEYAAIKARYPDLAIAYGHITNNIYYYSYDGSELLNTETVLDGGNGSYNGKPSRTSTAQYDYTFIGWSKQLDSTSVDSDSITSVTADRKVFAAYSHTIRKYTVYFINSGSTLQTVKNVPYGGSASYTGATPVSRDGSAEDYPFLGWDPQPKNITGNTFCYAMFGSPVLVKEITDTWEEIIASMDDGTYRQKYKIGNYLPLTVGDKSYLVTIVGFDADPLSDGSGKAKISCIFRERLAYSGYCFNKENAKYTTDADGNKVYTMGTGSIGGWGHSQRRTWFQTEFYPTLPEAVRNRIATVNKFYTYIGTDGGDIQNGISADTVWEVDLGELCKSRNNGLYKAWVNAEGDDATLTERYRTSKYTSTTQDYVACRQVAKSGHVDMAGYIRVNGTGQGWNDGNSQNGGMGIIPGFCLN